MIKPIPAFIAKTKYWKTYSSSHHTIHVDKKVHLFPIPQNALAHLADDIHDAIVEIFPKAETQKKIDIYISHWGGNWGKWPHMITLMVCWGNAFSANMMSEELLHSAYTRMAVGEGELEHDHNRIKQGILGRVQRKVPWYVRLFWFKGYDTRG